MENKLILEIKSFLKNHSKTIREYNSREEILNDFVQYVNSKTEENFYSHIINNLKEEAKQLNGTLTLIREGKTKNGDMNNYIATLKSLRETLDLISKYNWQFHYSTYGLKQDESEEYKRVISVWEQNHDCQIRNHRVWELGNEILNDKIILSKDGYETYKSLL